MLFSDVIIVA